MVIRKDTANTTWEYLAILQQTAPVLSTRKLSKHRSMFSDTMMVTRNRPYRRVRFLTQPVWRKELLHLLEGVNPFFNFCEA